MEKIISYRWFDGDDNLQDAFTVRMEVFCDEQGYSPDMEFDETDRTARHIVAYENGRAVATGRLYNTDKDTLVFGRIAVRKAWRGQGVGAGIMKEMLAEAEIVGAAKVVLDAQCRAIGFYKTLGFTVIGEKHMDGHVVHQMMAKKLR